MFMDKAYIDFKRLWRLAQENINFVIRAKDNMKFKVVDRGATDRKTGVICDQAIMLTNIASAKNYPGPPRRIRYYDSATGKTLVFITNNFKITALNVAALYRYCWGIETFFKWIKQHLKIQKFWGHSENAVRTQIWIAIASYVIVAIAKKKLKLSHSLYEILQQISLAAFERTPLKNLVAEKKNQDVKEQICNQLILF